MATDNVAWLNASYVENVLRNARKDDSIKVTNLTVKPATAIGDNYMSLMHRVSVEFSRVQDGHVIQETKSIIVKVIPQEGMREELLESTGYFQVEMLMMLNTLQPMNQILEDVGLTPISARCLHLQFEKPNHIVLEDLMPRGFRMAKYQSLDLDHYILALRNLARFHAASVALKEKDPKALTEYKRGLYHMDNMQMTGNVFHSGAKCVANLAAEWPELSSRILEKLQKLADVVFVKGCEVAAYREDDFNVLNHGDYWINNMMFRYDDQQKPIDHLLVDFQLSHYGPPASDILYFFGSSVNEDIRFHHRKLLLGEYYNSLISTMTKLKCSTKPPSFLELEESLKNLGFCEVSATIVLMAGVVFDEGPRLGFDDYVKANENGTNPIYRGKSFRRIMTKLLPIYDSMGLLDV